jgi:5-methylthioadenosine/S-adenosylhomocysteine deaminase
VHSGRGTAQAFKANIEEALRAYDQSGMRVAFAAGMTEQNFLVWDDDQKFLATLPAPLREMAAARLPSADTLTVDDYFDVFDELWRQVKSHPRMDLWFGPPGPQWVSDSFMTRIAERAEHYDTGIQTHLLESTYERYHGRRVYGRPTLLHLHELGILSPRLSFAHGVWLSEEEIDVAAIAGVHVSHNPSSNLRLRAGIAPLTAMLAAGLNTGLGMDGTTLNDDEDMFAEMRLALNLHRAPQLSASAPHAADVWRMATEGGARLFQAETRLGRLAPGYAADMVLLRLDRILWPWTAPEVDPALLLLTRAATRDVDIVMVGGDVVLRDGIPLRIDVENAGAELAKLLTSTPYPQEAERMVEALLPHLKAYYQSWERDDLAPYTTYHSRV